MANLLGLDYRMDENGNLVPYFENPYVPKVVQAQQRPANTMPAPQPAQQPVQQRPQSPVNMTQGGGTDWKNVAGILGSSMMAMSNNPNLASMGAKGMDRLSAMKSQREIKNKTLAALKQRGASDQDIALLEANPELISAYAKNIFATPKDDSTSAMKEYRFAVSQGYRGNFEDYQKEMKKAGATNINMPTEGERKAGALASRLSFAMQQIQDVLGSEGGSEAESPTLAEKAAGAIGGSTGERLVSSPDRQVVTAAQLDMLDAALTLGTGAAYTKEQLEGYRTSYFPQYGDSEQTIKAKEARLMNLIETAKSAAGRAGVNIQMPTSSGGGKLVFNTSTGKLETK
jgi:hypothetical protein